MGKYRLTFTKWGYVKFTSHLDLVRLFKRSFKRSNIGLKFSQGYNPHPKMVFAQPLSLGYSSVGEILEFETNEDLDIKYIEDAINKQLPIGMDVLKIEEISNKDNFASTVEKALYLIKLDNGLFTSEQIESLMACDEIISERYRKKKVGRRGKKIKELVEINIRPLINTLEYFEANEVDSPCSRLDLDNNQKAVLSNIILSHGEDSSYLLANLNTGSTSNLNPEIFIKGIFKFFEINDGIEKIHVVRLKLINKQ